MEGIFLKKSKLIYLVFLNLFLFVSLISIQPKANAASYYDDGVIEFKESYNDSSEDGGGAGNNTLPKTGERSTNYTIIGVILISTSLVFVRSRYKKEINNEEK